MPVCPAELPNPTGRRDRSTPHGLLNHLTTTALAHGVRDGARGTFVIGRPKPETARISCCGLPPISTHRPPLHPAKPSAFLVHHAGTDAGLSRLKLAGPGPPSDLWPVLPGSFLPCAALPLPDQDQAPPRFFIRRDGRVAPSKTCSPDTHIHLLSHPICLGLVDFWLPVDRPFFVLLLVRIVSVILSSSTSSQVPTTNTTRLPARPTMITHAQ
jgi:hypothetical protein